MSIENRINFLEEKIEEHRALIFHSESVISKGIDNIEETQRALEDLREFIWNRHNDINEMESELEVLREEQSEQYLNKTSAEDRDWHSMKL